MFGLIFTSLICELFLISINSIETKGATRRGNKRFFLVDRNLSAAWTTNIELCFVMFLYGLSCGFPTQEVQRDKETNASYLWHQGNHHISPHLGTEGPERLIPT
jgi:hypothetical protein